MQNKTFYNEILTEHNRNPYHKHPLKVVDASFQGDGCAISQASADMMIDLVLGKTKQEALELADRFLRMIRGEATEDEKESLDEAAILEDVSHMPARVKCATLGWHTIQEMLKDKEA